MQKNKNRQGLALGAVFAMVASLFVMTSPAQASESSVVIYPKIGLATQTTMLNGEAFDIDLRFGTSVNSAFTSVTSATAKNIGLVISKPAGVTVSSKVTNAGAGQITTATVSAGVEISGTEFVVVFASSTSPYISLELAQRTSVSAAVTLTVTPFIDMDNDATYSNGDSVGTAMTVNFIPYSALGATVSLEQTVETDRGSSISFAVTPNAAINWAQLDSAFAISASHLHKLRNASGGTGMTNSALIGAVQFAASVGASTGSANAQGITKAGGYSASYKVITAAYTTSDTTSASVWYNGEIVVQTDTMTTENTLTTNVTVSPVTSVNLVQTNDGTADARTNGAFSVKAYPHGASITTSVLAVSAFTVSQLANIEFGAQAGVILNGVTYTSSAAFAKAGFALAAGGATIPVSTFGQAGSGTIGFSLTSQLKTDELVITVKGTEQVPVFTPTAVAGLAGVAKSFAVTAYDQWGVASARTDQRIAASVKLGSTTSLTVSTALVNGAATVTVTPTPATGTGSAVVTFTLQTLDQSTQEWVDTATRDSAEWNIYTYAAGTDAFTSRTVSVPRHPSPMEWLHVLVSCSCSCCSEELIQRRCSFGSWSNDSELRPGNRNC